MSITFEVWEPSTDGAWYVPQDNTPEPPKEERYTNSEYLSKYWIYWLTKKMSDWAESCPPYSIDFMDFDKNNERNFVSSGNSWSTQSSRYVGFRFWGLKETEQAQQLYEKPHWISIRCSGLSSSGRYGLTHDHFTQENPRWLIPSDTPGLSGWQVLDNDSYPESRSFSEQDGRPFGTDYLDTPNPTQTFAQYPLPDGTNNRPFGIENKRKRLWICYSNDPGNEYIAWAQPVVGGFQTRYIGRIQNASRLLRETVSLQAGWIYWCDSWSTYYITQRPLWYPFMNRDYIPNVQSQNEDQAWCGNINTYSLSSSCGSGATTRPSYNYEGYNDKYNFGPWATDIKFYDICNRPIFSTGDNIIYNYNTANRQEAVTISNMGGYNNSTIQGQTQIRVDGKLYLALKPGAFLRIE